jgi:putative NADH-flavin reductase
MSTFAIIGSTGYGGRNITAEALARNHRVIGVSRHAPTTADAGVDVRTGSIEDRALLTRLFADADVVLVAVHGSVDGRPFLVHLVPDLLALAAEHGTRLGFIGGSGSLHTTEGGPRLIDSPDFTFKNRTEAAAQAQVLDALRAADTEADWFYVSPAFVYGAHAPGERTGSYRVGGDVLLTGSDGRSEISGPDFARAIVDELETPAHSRTRFTVAH